MNDFDLKHQKIQTIAKWAALPILGFFVAPVIFLAIKGLIGLLVAAVISVFVVQVGIPWFSLKLANWRIGALKAESMKNPVLTLQSQYVKKQSALDEFKHQIGIFTSQVLNFADQVKQYVREGLEDADVYKEQLSKMNQLLQNRQQKYQDAKQALADFADTIQKTERKWKMACAAVAMNEAAGQIAGDVFDKICIETALDSVQTKLNQSFADLEIALLDDDKSKQQNKNPKLADKSSVVDITTTPANSNVRQKITI